MIAKRMSLAGLALVCAAGGAAPSLAATGFYVGVMAGQAHYHQHVSDLDNSVVGAFEGNGFAVTSSTSSLDDTDFAIGGFVGYQFLPQLAAEAGYLDLGKLKYASSGRVTDGFASYPSSADFSASAKGPTLSAMGILPLAPAFDVYARAGILFAKVKLTANVTVSGVSGSDSVSSNSADPLLGIGAAWHVGNRFTLRADYARFFNVGDKDKTGESNIDLFTVGVTYSIE